MKLQNVVVRRPAGDRVLVGTSDRREMCFACGVVLRPGTVFAYLASTGPCEVYDLGCAQDRGLVDADAR